MVNAPPPFLKWPGGKRWLVRDHADWLARPCERFVEPFLGGGAAFFHLAPGRAALSDLNPDLMCMYEGVRDRPGEVFALLETHQRAHSKSHYYRVRAEIPAKEAPAARAARLIYLNRTCFNGIFRVNRRGVFNVPIGTKTAVVLPTDDFDALSEILSAADLRCCDFETTLAETGRGDLIFADPPYTVRHNCNGFVKYNETLFSWADQVRLARALAAARDRGAVVRATNAAHDSVRGLYSRFGFRHDRVRRYSSMAAAGDRRGRYGELLISSQDRSNGSKSPPPSSTIPQIS